MARKALYKHATQVDTTAYPDDGSSPVGSNEWNADPDAQGMLGFTPANATRTISSGVVTPTDSVHIIAAESGTSDDLDKLATTNTNEYDLIYLFADTGDTITLKNTSNPSADGQIKTVSDADETLSTTKPSILIRKGNYWYGYGGGSVGAGSITTAKLANDAVDGTKIADDAINSEHYVDASIDTAHIADDQVTQAKIAAGAVGTTELADNGVTGAKIALGSDAVGDIMYHNGTDYVRLAKGSANEVLQMGGSNIPEWGAVAATEIAAGAVGTSELAADAVDGTKIADDAINSEHYTDGSIDLVHLSADSVDGTKIADDAINSEHYVDGSIDTAHIADDQVTLAKMAGLARGKIIYGDSSGNPAALTIGTNGQALKSVGSDLVWGSAGGGATIVHTFTNSTNTSYAGTASSFGTVGVGDRDIYVKKIDANNEGVFTKVWKNGSAVEVQIA